MLELFAAIAAEVVLDFVLFMPISNDFCGKAVGAVKGSLDFDHAALPFTPDHTIGHTTSSKQAPLRR